MFCDGFSEMLTTGKPEAMSTYRPQFSINMYLIASNVYKLNTPVHFSNTTTSPSFENTGLCNRTLENKEHSNSCKSYEIYILLYLHLPVFCGSLYAFSRLFSANYLVNRVKMCSLDSFKFR